MYNFDSIFQIYVGLNFGYAIVENSRPDFFNIISDNISKLDNLEKTEGPQKISGSEFGRTNEITAEEAKTAEIHQNNRANVINTIKQIKSKFLEISDPIIIIKGSIFYGFFSFFILFINIFVENDTKEYWILISIILFLNLPYSIRYIFNSKSYSFKEITFHFFIFIFVSWTIKTFIPSNNIDLSDFKPFLSFILLLVPIFHFIFYLIKIGIFDKFTLEPEIDQLTKYIEYTIPLKKVFNNFMDKIKNRK